MVAGCKQIPGILSVEADRSSARLTVRYDPAVTSEAAVLKAVQKVVDSIDR